MTVDDLFTLALQNHQAGNLPMAEHLYRQVLQAEPRHANSCHLLGVIAYQSGRFDQAAVAIRHAISLNPTVGDYHSNLGLVLEAMGQLDCAVASYQEALRMQPDFPEGHTNVGNVLFRQGKLQASASHYLAALRQRPSYAGAHCGLGVVFAAQGKLDEAALHYRQALGINPHYPEAHNNLAHALLSQGKLNEAKTHCYLALSIKPDFAEAHNNLGDALQRQGNLDEAATHWREAVRIRPAIPAAHACLGNVMVLKEKWDEAITHFRAALRFDPKFAEAHNGMGIVLERQNKLPEAIDCYREALRCKPTLADAANNMGIALMRQGALEEAMSCYREALRLNPDYAEAHYHLAMALERQDRFDDAIKSYREAVRLKPDFVDAWNNLGSALGLVNEIEEAVRCLAQALRLNPRFALAHLNCAMLWLLRGDFQRGWPEYEWRWTHLGKSRREFSQPCWNGSRLDGRPILLYAEQGLGDTLQFIRYLPLVKERGGITILECQPGLTRLLASAPGIDHLVPAGTTLPTFDCQAPLLGLPGIFKTSLATIPVKVPYLQADATLVEHWRKQLADIGHQTTDIGRAFKIGIAWQGSPTYRYDRQRSIPLKQFGRLAQLKGVELISLQIGPGTDQLRSAPWHCLTDADSALTGSQTADGVRQAVARPTIVDLGDKLDEAAGAFMDTAAVMMNLDLVISSDTAVPHLAGALGVPVWLVLPTLPDWRWLLERQDSPWYPSMRIFRQSKPGQWEEVFERIADHVAALAMKS